MNESDKEALTGQAMKTMRDITFAEGVELARLVGMVQANRMHETMSKAMQLMVLKKIHDEQLYVNLPKLNGKGASNWETFCQDYYGKSEKTVNEQIAMLDALGADVADAMFRLGLKPRQMHKLIEGGETTNEDLRKAITSAGDDIAALREDVNRILQEKDAKAACEVEQLGRVIDQRDREIDKRKRNEARVEDDNRMLRKENNELKSGWSPSEEETEAIEQLNQINGVIQQHFAKMHLIILRAGHHRPVLNHLHGILQNDYGLEDGWVSLTREKLGDKLNEEAHRTAAEPAGKGGRK